MTSADEFNVIPLPRTRIAVREMLASASRKHLIHGLLEVDVTRPRAIIRQAKKERGEKFSFTAFVVCCLAQAVNEHKIMHAYRRGAQLLLFEDVDVNTQIGRELDGRKWVVPYIIRSANNKTYRQIHDEIRLVQTKEITEVNELRSFNLYLRLPRFVRSIFWRFLDRSPRLTKKLAGTVGVTSLGMFSRGSFWGIPITTQTLLLTVGGISEKPVLIDGHPEAREFLSLTMTIDHDIVDGAPAVRFGPTLQDLIESGHALDQITMPGAVPNVAKQAPTKE